MKATVLIIMACLVLGCNDNQKTASKEDILVSIGSDSITVDEFHNSLNNLSLKQKSIYTSSPERLDEFLQTQINEKVLYNEALKRGIQDRPDIQKELDTYKKKLISKTLGREILDDLELTDEEIKEYYDQNKQDYERMDISKIVIKYKPDDEESKRSALSKSKLIVDRAKSGESFEDLAAEFSEDAFTKNKGGKAGYVKKGMLPGDIESVIFSLKEGDITKPFEVENGYLIIKVNKEADIPPYQQVERNIRSTLINDRLISYINNLRNDWNVKIYDEKLKEISNSESK